MSTRIRDHRLGYGIALQAPRERFAPLEAAIAIAGVGASGVCGGIDCYWLAFRGVAVELRLVAGISFQFPQVLRRAVVLIALTNSGGLLRLPQFGAGTGAFRCDRALPLLHQRSSRNGNGGGGGVEDADLAASFQSIDVCTR